MTRLLFHAAAKLTALKTFTERSFRVRDYSTDRVGTPYVSRNGTPYIRDESDRLHQVRQMESIGGYDEGRVWTDLAKALNKAKGKQ